MVANLAAGYNGQLARRQRHVRRHRARPGQVRRRRRGGRRRLPEPRPRAAADRVASRLVHVARRSRGRTAPPRCRPTARASARPTSCSPCPHPSPRRSAGTTEPPTWGDVFESASDAEPVERSRPPRVGRVQARQDEPDGRDVRRGGDVRILRHRRRRPRGSLGRRRSPTRPCRTTVREHELATSHYMATPEHFLWHARQADDKGSAADFLSAVIVDEKSVWDYNRGITSRDGVTRVEGDAARGAARPDLSHRRLLRRRQPRRRAHRRLGRPERGGCRGGLHPLRRHRAGPGDRARTSGYRDLNGDAR